MGERPAALASATPTRNRRIAALEAENARLAAALRWAVEYMEDGLPEWDAPRHECEFHSNPEKGACDFHDAWAEARSLVESAAPVQPGGREP